MKAFLALLVGLVIGAAVVWYYHTGQGHATVHSSVEKTGAELERARNAFQEQVDKWDLRPEQIKEDLAKSGQVVRQKARQAGQAIADATVDARITGAIKGKLLASKDLSSTSISVNTTEGVVTLSGTVNVPDDISKAVALALDTEGVNKVISTLQVKQKAAKPS
jgi:osmotically-inducible protein OsmY